MAPIFFSAAWSFCCASGSPVHSHALGISEHNLHCLIILPGSATPHQRVCGDFSDAAQTSPELARIKRALPDKFNDLNSVSIVSADGTVPVKSLWPSCRRCKPVILPNDGGIWPVISLYVTLKTVKPVRSPILLCIWSVGVGGTGQD